MNPTIKTTGYVYIIEAVGTDRFKIGYSTSPETRLAQLQTGSAFALKLSGTWPASIEIEKSLHERLAAYRVNGEWFHVPQNTEFSIVDLIAEVTRSTATQNAKCRVDLRGTGTRNKTIRDHVDMITSMYEVEAECLDIREHLKPILELHPDLASVVTLIDRAAAIALDRVMASRRFMLDCEPITGKNLPS